ncbi:MAG: methylcrotonoyl-CoA carboxylase [Proteobacteria bacterium]|nr:methylcrotonoyl-CoA carboxylase [Pseudomonadota bacterium]
MSSPCTLSFSYDPKSVSFQDNLSYHRRSISELKVKLVVAQLGGVTKSQDSGRKADQDNSIAKSTSQQILTARQRIALLQDSDTHFLELSALAGLNLYDEPLPSAGIITGVIQVEGRLCMVMANDHSVKGGAYYPITVKKQLRAQHIAGRCGLPCLYLVDSAGANLHHQADLFADADHFGRLFYEQARLGRKGIAQLSVVHGSCIAGGAYIPAMSEQTIMVKGRGRIFLAGPLLVKAAIGQDISAEELGGTAAHSQSSGLVDYVVSSDASAMKKLRQLVAALPQQHHSSQMTMEMFKESTLPKYDMADFLGRLPVDHKVPFDPRELLACLLDESYFLEFKADYDPHLVTGFGYMYGMEVGVVANYGVLHIKSAQKGSHFIDLCSVRGIPLLFIQNVSGFMVGKDAEHGGIAKEGAKMVHAVAGAQVPKVTLIVGGSHGAGNYGMCGRGFLGDFLFTWPSARVSIMGAKQAAYVMEQLALKKNSQKVFDKKEYMERFSKQSCPYYATARLWDDGLIDPLSTRKTLGLAFGATLLRRQKFSKRGIIRM